MAASRKAPGSEIEAIGAVHTALKDLDASAQLRVIRYVAEMLGLTLEAVRPANYGSVGSDSGPSGETLMTRSTTSLPSTDQVEDVDGINPVALKLIRRSGLSPNRLQDLFSLGIDEIDLVAKKVPGDGKKERMRNVALLKGIAAYLGTGAARISYEQLKEACLHYDAYDNTNFARYLKSFSADLSGTKETGLTLTPRGLTSAMELVKKLLPAEA